MSLWDQAKNYKAARDKWVDAGKPLRSPEEIQKLFELCEQCPAKQFMRVGPDVGRCLDCGCWLKRQGNSFNKLAWPTEKCPRGYWDATFTDE